MVETKIVTNPVPAQKRPSAVERTIVPLALIVPDPKNRRVLDDEELQGLVDSIRILGLLQPVHVRKLDDGRYQLIDGERRWRAAERAGLKEIPCDLWAAEIDRARTTLAGLHLNEQRKAPGCIHVARRLRDLKNELALSHEQLAARCGIPLDRVKTYFALLGTSDALLTFFEGHDIPLKVAVEFARYERSTNEARSRHLIARYLESPMTVQELMAFRKRQEGKGKAREEKTEPGVRVDATERLFARLEGLLERDAETALPKLEHVLGRFGFKLHKASQKAGRG